MKSDMFFFLTTAAATLAAVWFMTAWLQSRRSLRQLRDRLWGMAVAQGHPLAGVDDQMPMTLPQSNGRIDQLETQMDSVSQQLERLAESQEFMSRILAERIDRLPDPRLRTPH